MPCMMAVHRIALISTDKLELVRTTGVFKGRNIYVIMKSASCRHKITPQCFYPTKAVSEEPPDEVLCQSRRLRCLVGDLQQRCPGLHRTGRADVIEAVHAFHRRVVWNMHSAYPKNKPKKTSWLGRWSG